MATQTIKLNKETTLKLDSSIGWLLIYRAQFGRDILPDLLPVMNAAIEIVVSTLESAGEEVNPRTIAKALRDSGSLSDIMIHLASLELTTIINIVWAMAKNAADKTGDAMDPPLEWAQKLEDFPVDVILPKIWSMTSKSMVSTKNLNRLQGAMKNLQPLQPNNSLSEV